MPRTSPSASRGFTLVEVLMAMLIMTVGLLGLLQSIQIAYQQQARNRMREEAVLVAAQQMNQYKTMPFERITSHSQTFSSTGRNGTKYSVKRDFSDIGEAAGAKRLMVTVAWVFQNVTAKHEIYNFKAR